MLQIIGHIRMSLNYRRLFHRVKVNKIENLIGDISMNLNYIFYMLQIILKTCENIVHDHQTKNSSLYKTLIFRRIFHMELPIHINPALQQ